MVAVPARLVRSRLGRLSHLALTPVDLERSVLLEHHIFQNLGFQHLLKVLGDQRHLLPRVHCPRDPCPRRLHNRVSRSLERNGHESDVRPISLTSAASRNHSCRYHHTRLYPGNTNSVLAAAEHQRTEMEYESSMAYRTLRPCQARVMFDLYKASLRNKRMKRGGFASRSCSMPASGLILLRINDHKLRKAVIWTAGRGPIHN